MSRKSSETNQEKCSHSQKLCVKRGISLTVSKVTSNVFTMALFRQENSGTQKGFLLYYITTTLELRWNKVLSHLSGVPVKACYPSARAAYSEMCPVKRWTAAAQCLKCCAKNWKVAGSIPASVGFFIDIKSFRSHYGPGVDSVCNRNEYQEHFLGVKAAGA